MISLILAFLDSKWSMTMLKDGRKACEIGFAISIGMSGPGALDRQLANSVSQAREGTADMILPSLGDAIASIDMATTAGTRIIQATETFTPLLSKIAKFNDLVKRIAEVLLSSGLSALAKDLLSL
jgi:hypothetical protein